MSRYVPPKMCWGGVAGSNSGPSCEETALYKASRHTDPNCHGATISDTCMENNENGMGDGCPQADGADPGDMRDEASCKSYKSPGKRDASESFDGTTGHCRWVPAKTKVLPLLLSFLCCRFDLSI